MSSKTCICCHNKNYLITTNGLYVHNDNLKKYDFEIYLCDKCISIIKQEKYSNDMSNSLIFLRELVDLCNTIDELKRILNEIVSTSIYINVNNGIKEFKNNFDYINRYQKEINEYIDKINNMYDSLMPELALIGLKKTASLFFSFTGRELIDFLGIKQSSINKFRKINNISGSGYIYGKSEIEEILSM